MKRLLKRLGACSEAVEWVGKRTLAEAWRDCERGDWMLWLCAQMIGKKGWPTHQEVVLAACAYTANAAYAAANAANGAAKKKSQLRTANICRRMLTVPS